MRAALIVLALILASILALGPAWADGPSRYEPLSAGESLQAVSRVEARRGAQPERSAATGDPAEAEPRELLRVERRQRSKGEHRSGLGRSADVYFYDYERNVTRHSIVSLPSGEVESEEDLVGVQLPLTEREVKRATRIAYAHPALRARIQELFRQATGQPLEALDQLHRKAMVFSAESMPGSVNEASRRCGVHRCAQLLLFTTEHVTVEVIPIVDLSTGALVQVLDF